jgi:hypothetical protein
MVAVKSQRLGATSDRLHIPRLVNGVINGVRLRILTIPSVFQLRFMLGIFTDPIHILFDFRHPARRFGSFAMTLVRSPDACGRISGTALHHARPLVQEVTRSQHRHHHPPPRLPLRPPQLRVSLHPILKTPSSRLRVPLRPSRLCGSNSSDLADIHPWQHTGHPIFSTHERNHL